MTKQEIVQQFNLVRNNRHSEFKLYVASETTRLICRNVLVAFPHDFDFSRVTISPSNPDAAKRSEHDFANTPSGSLRIYRVSADMGLVEIVIEPLFLSESGTDEGGDAMDIDLSSITTPAVPSETSQDMPSAEVLRMYSHCIRVTAIQDNMEIDGGKDIVRPPTDVVVSTPHYMCLEYAPLSFALFSHGPFWVDGKQITSPSKNVLAIRSLDRIAASLGIVTPSTPRDDATMPVSVNGSVIENFSHIESMMRHDDENEMNDSRRGHFKNPFRNLPVAELTSMMHWRRGSGFVIDADVNKLRSRRRRRIAGVGADGVIPEDKEERIEHQVCDAYLNPKTKTVIVTFRNRWILSFVPEHDSGHITSYIVRTNTYFWDIDRTSRDHPEVFEVACGPRVPFYQTDIVLSDLRSCIDDSGSMRDQLVHMGEVGGAPVAVPQLKDHYSIVRIYTHVFRTLITVNYTKAAGTIFDNEDLHTRNVSLYWRVAVPHTTLFDQNGIIPEPNVSDEDQEVMNASAITNASVRLIVNRAGFYSISEIMEAPIYDVRERSFMPNTTGRSLFEEDSPMHNPAFIEHGKVHLARNSMSVTEKLSSVDKYAIDKRNVMQLVLASTIAKRVTENEKLVFGPIANLAAVIYTHVAHTSTNIHKRYPWIAGVFPWLTFDLSIPLDPFRLRDQQKANDIPRKRGKLTKYETCRFCDMLTIPINSVRAPRRHNQNSCPVFFEHSNSERRLLEFLMPHLNALTRSFKDQLLISVPPPSKPNVEQGPNVNGYRLNVSYFVSQRSRLRGQFLSRLNTLVKCEDTVLGSMYVEDLKLKHSAVVVPSRLPWATLLTSFEGTRMTDVIADDKTELIGNDVDVIVKMDEDGEFDTPIVPREELRSIFFKLHTELKMALEEARQQAEQSSMLESSSSYSSSSEDES
jgi:hypothetical protein